MKNFKRFLVAVLALLTISTAAQAQFRWGIKAGANFNSLHLSKEAIKDIGDSENRTGFTGGLMAEFQVPVIGICFDASLMYTHRVNNINDSDANLRTYNNDYLSVPINLKYKFGLPVIGSFFTPYIYTGPDFSFLVSKKDAIAAVTNKSVDVSWNVGIGFQIVSHLQLQAGYGFGINKAADIIGGSTLNPTKIEAKSNCWTVTAAYLF